ncbi:MAG: DEAD/DEAH box helicase [Rikenellaceae bacterium]
MYFDELDLDYDVLDAIDEMGFGEMTPVQEATIPVILSGDDLIGCAQTGTGKTAAYALPLLSMLMDGRADGSYEESKIKAIIMVPTRELAMQIDTQLQGFSYYLPISTTVVYGGGDGKTWDVQRRGMNSGADIVVATPGRLLAHLEGGVDFSGVKHFILDEADRMLDMGFFDDIMRVVKKLSTDRQTILFSATLPPKIRELSKQILRNPQEVNIAISKPNESIDQGIYVCYESQKLGIISKLFETPSETKTIIFSSSKLKVKDLAFQFKRMKLNVGAMHSDLDQAKREEVMLAFKNNKINILVATDIVARGIDITDIGMVINYDVPHDPEDYIHRIGRTGRASATGVAITFVSEKEQGKFHRIEEFIEKTIKQLELPAEVGEPPVYNPKTPVVRDSRGGRKGGGNKNKSRKPKGASPKSQDGSDTKVDTIPQLQAEVVSAKPKKRRFNKRRKPKSEKGEQSTTIATAPKEQ